MKSAHQTLSPLTDVSMMAASGWSDTVWAVIIVPVVLAVCGGLWKWALTVGERRAATREARRTATKELFTAALDAVHEYQELPYRVRRRSDVSPMTAAELTAYASDVQVQLDKYVTRLRLEDDDVGAAYQALVTEVRREAGAHMSRAWTEPRITTDEAMNLGNAYPRQQAEAATTACMEAMECHLEIPHRHRRVRLPIRT